VVAVTLQAADMGDTTTMDATLIEAGMAVAELVVEQAGSHSEENKIIFAASKNWLQTRAI